MLTDPGKFTDAQKVAISTELIRAISMFAIEWTLCTSAEEDLNRIAVALRPAIQTIADTPNKRRYLGAVAARSWNLRDIAHPGLMITGDVQAVRVVGNLYETKIRLPDDAATVIPVYSAQDPAAVCRVGAWVYCFGVIVDNPVDQLTDYSGDASKVVWTRRFDAGEQDDVSREAP